jgi:signal transduction histidine kinase
VTTGGPPGLGVSTVKSIADVHNGLIQVQSEPNHGSVFQIYIVSNSSKQGLAVVH